MSDIFIARRGLIARIDGRTVHVYKGDTVRAGHKLLSLNPDAFKPLEVKFDLAAGGKGRTRRGEESSAA